jgi:predicted RNase H-like HicB family nuclease
LFPDGEKTGVRLPDLPGCVAFGSNTAEAMLIAKDAAELWLWNSENKRKPIPEASESLDIIEGEMITLIAADTNEYRKANDTQSVKKTLSIPAWLNYQAEKANAPFSQILQQALKEYLEDYE